MPNRDRQVRTSASRVFATILAAAALMGVGLVILAGNRAGAMGGGNPAAVILEPSAATPGAPSFNTGGDPELLSEPHTRTRAVAKREVRPGLAVCVRLCDGFFFPSNTASGGDEVCNAQCPDAPSALYREPYGSDKIEDAISTSGAPYTALPVAGSYRTNLDITCTCHRESASYSAMLLHDPTLRKGDAVMTPNGLVVYEGGNTPVIRREDFTALARAKSAPSNIRAELSQLRSAGAVDRQIGHFLSASTDFSSSSPEDVTRPVKKASVWVETPSDTSTR